MTAPSRRKNRSFRGIILMILSMSMFVTILDLGVRPVRATPSPATNTTDTFNQNWVGMRPLRNNDLTNYYQRVTSTGGDSNTGISLSAQVSTLLTGVSGSTSDTAQMGVMMYANSRGAISYTINGFNPFPYSYPDFSGSTALGICGGCGTWVNLQHDIVYYGAAADVGEYSRVWVSSNGFISVMGPNCCGNGWNGVIAAFERPLTLGASGHIYTFYNSGSQETWFAWDNVKSNDSTGNLESFAILLQDSSRSPYRETGIQFWYKSITPNDGTPTAVGIGDQVGQRIVTASSSSLSNNLMWQVQATSGPMYLNSLSITFTPTSNGQPDGSAYFGFDLQSSTSPVGYNVIMASSISDLSTLLPPYAKLGLSAASLAPTPWGMFIGGLLFGADTYDTALHNYWDSQLLQPPQSQTQPGNPASLSATARIPGAFASNPLDASLGATFRWFMNDNPRNVLHHLGITATITYSAAIFGTPTNVNSASASVSMDFVPDSKVWASNFASGILQPFITPVTTPVTSSWLVNTNCPPTGSTDTTQPNCFSGTNDANARYPMSGSVVMQLNVNFVNYNYVVLYPHIWISLNYQDSFSIEYLNGGGWNYIYGGDPGTINFVAGQVSTIGGRGNTPFTQWINPTLVLPASTSAIRFRVQASGSSGGVGAYVSDLALFADGSLSSADLRVDGLINPGSSNAGYSVQAPVSLDGGAFYAAQVHYLTTFGPHTLNVAMYFSDINSNSGYQFSHWADTGSTSTTESVSVSSSQQTSTAYYNPIPDFVISSSPTSISIAPGSSGSSTVTLTSRNSFSGTVALSTSLSPSASSPPTVTLNPSSVAMTSAGSVQATVTVSTTSSTTQQAYSVRVTATSGVVTVSTTISASVSAPSGGSGGSVASGTLITLADGSLVPVQNLALGEKLLSYNMTTGQFATSTITRFFAVVASNQMEIHTSTGKPLIVDQSPAQRVYVKLPDGTVSLVPVTDLRVGYDLFEAVSQSWVPITALLYQNGGAHVMYDVYTSDPFNYIANGYLDPLKT